MTVEEAAKQENACKLVTIKDVTLVKAVEGEYTNYYTDAEKTMQISTSSNLVTNLIRRLQWTIQVSSFHSIPR